MDKVKVFYIQYDLYCVFAKGNKAYIRRAYIQKDGTIKYRFNNQWITSEYHY